MTDAPVIGFDAATHRYTLDGMPVPGVSEVLTPAYDFRFVDAGAMERARDLGTKVHRTVELFEQGTLNLATLHPVLLAHLDQYRRFKDDFRYVSLGQEVKVASRRHRYCGTLDNWGRFEPAQAGEPEEYALPDIKTGAIYAPHKLQTAAYKLAAVEMGFLPKTAKRLSVYLAEDQYEVRWHTHNAIDEAAFVALRTFHHWSEHHGQ
jgi:hypothetical protein